MDIFLPILGLLMIMVFIVGATIKINSLMKGKIINSLLNKKLLQKFFDISGTVVGLYFGYLLSQHIFSIFVGEEGLFSDFQGN